MLAERLDYGEYNLAGGRYYSIAVDKVEETVGIALFVRVDAVEIHHLKERLTVETRHREVVYLRACSIRQIFDVELELGFLYLVAAK